MLVYIITCNGSVSSEGYSTLEGAISEYNRRTRSKWQGTGYPSGVFGTTLYQVQDIRIK